MPLDAESLKRENLSLKEALKLRDAFSKSMTDIAVGFVYPSNLDSAINRALQELLSWSKADRAIIMQVYPEDMHMMGISHEVCRMGVHPIKQFAQNIPVVIHEYFEEMHYRQGYVEVCNTNKLPPSAASIKAMYQKNKVGSAAACSFISRNKFNGYVGLINQRSVEEWNPDSIQLLRTIAVLIEHTWERVEMEKKLVEAKLRAEESDRMKTTFMANLSHEIRTPLNGILGFTNLITSRSLTSEKQKRYADIIDINSRQLLTVINDLLDISKIESGILKLEKEKVSINMVIIAIYEYYLNEINDNKEIELFLNIPDSKADYTLITDSSRLKQIIDNLMRNAINFTPKGKITLGYLIEKNSIHLFIRDTGIGIEKKNLKNIFKRFWQLDSTISSPFGSNGLGLSITNDLVNLMGGEILVYSEPGIGSEFTVKLPLSIKPSSN